MATKFTSKLMNPLNPVSKMSSKEIAERRQAGENVDSWSNPYFTGGGQYSPGGTLYYGSEPASATSAAQVSTLPSASAPSASAPISADLSSAVSGSFWDMDKYLSELKSIQAQNNAWSAQQAQKQMDFQRSESDRAIKFNHDEAELSRAWTERMSDTAHQREVKDLQAAGLNPVLSAYGGNGAPVTSGAVASGYQSQSGAKGDTDTSLSSALVHLLGMAMSAQASMANAALSARTQESVADKYTSMSELVANIQRDTSLSVANINSMATKYASDVHADASKVSAAISAAAHRYGYDVMAMSNREIAEFNATVNAQLQAERIQADFDLRDAYPTSMFGALSSALGNILKPGTNSGLSSIGSVTSLLGKSISSLLDGFFK